MYFIASNRIDIIQSLEGRFEESVIAYLFLLNILPILIIPMTWIETSKFTDVLNNWTEFEVTPIHSIIQYYLQSVHEIFELLFLTKCLQKLFFSQNSRIKCNLDSVNYGI